MLASPFESSFEHPVRLIDDLAGIIWKEEMREVPIKTASLGINIFSFNKNNINVKYNYFNPVSMKLRIWQGRVRKLVESNSHRNNL